jgi:hypothetical protein
MYPDINLGFYFGLERPGGVKMGRDNWACKERTMYQDINLGYYFGLERPGMRMIKESG